MSHFSGMEVVAEPYFKDDEGLIEEFEIDYALVNEFDSKLTWRYTWCCPCFLCPCYYLACERQNILDLNNAKQKRKRSVAVTRDGIRYSVDHHKQLCRCDCLDEGRSMKTVPFDKITDCDVQEPGGSSGPICCMVKNVLSKVVVDTASSGSTNQDGVTRHELEIIGLKDPVRFKRLVWQMKREGVADIQHAAVSSALSSRNLLSGVKASSVQTMDREVVPLLMRQNELLEEHSHLLRQIAAK